MPSSEIIDVHAHMYPDGCFTEVIKHRSEFKLLAGPRGQSLLYRGGHVMSLPQDQADFKSRLGSMDAAGIDMALLSVGALNIGWAGSRDAVAARFVNDGLAALCRQHPNRFRFAAVLPYTNHAAMIGALDRALNMDAAAVGIATSVGDWPLHAPELRDFWREMSRRKLLVLVHPLSSPCDSCKRKLHHYPKTGASTKGDREHDGLSL
jgi:aminocarboxymuconate-semialdehyde decarboxylase